jgi:hypothetical protein
MADYVKIYWLEPYLFGEVAQRFRNTGSIDPADFYMIIIWKSNRAKTRTRKRLFKRAGTFAKAIKRISDCLRTRAGAQQRVELLMRAGSESGNT